MAADAHNKSSTCRLPLVALVLAAVGFVEIWSCGPITRAVIPAADPRSAVSETHGPTPANDSDNKSNSHTLVGKAVAQRPAQLKSDDARFDLKFWERANDGELRALRGAVSDRVALKAGWELVRRAVKSDGLPESVTRFPRFTIDRAELERFVGLLEGRLRIALPVWWENGLLDAVPQGNSRITTMCRTFYGDAAPYHLTELDVPIPDDLRPHLVDPDLPALTTSIFVPDVMSLELDGERVRVTIDGRSFPISLKLLEENSFYSMIALVEGDRVYLSFNGWSESELYCLNADTGRIIWRTQRCRRFGVFLEGQSTHFAELFLTEGRLFAFGDDGGLAYVDVFSKDSGDLELSFQTEDETPRSTQLSRQAD